MMKLALTPDQIARKLATLPEDRADQWLRENGYTGMAGVAMARKVRAARKVIQAGK